MASRRYSQSDQKKMVSDKLANWRARGVDAREIHATHPGGTLAQVTEMENNFNYVKDQAQEQDAANRARTGF